MNFRNIAILFCVCVLCIGLIVGLYYKVYSKHSEQNSVPKNSLVTDNTNIPGFQLGDTIKDVKTAQDCENLCMSNTKCQWYDYNKIGKYCHLKSAQSVLDMMTPKPSEVGFKLADKTFAQYDRFYIGETLNDGSSNNIDSPITGIPVEDCRARCLANPLCMYYRYGYDNSPTECHLKQLTDNMMMTHGQIYKRA
jgi:hypothetical protein